MTFSALTAKSLAFLSLASLFYARDARAELAYEAELKRAREERQSTTDGVYGRFDGDLDLGFALSTELESEAVRGGARLTAHYFAIAGIYTSYRQAFADQDDGDARVLSLGIDLRPAFVPRWARNMEKGPAFLDLWLDSISLGLGAFWAEPPNEHFGQVRGLETSLGFGLPLFGSANGLWLEARGAMRFPDVGARRDSLLLSLAWHTFLFTPWSGAD